VAGLVPACRRETLAGLLVIVLPAVKASVGNE
jgi:hypothetical protein